MHVLYVWNTAGISSIIDRYLGRAYDHRGTVMMRRSHDAHDTSAYYGCRMIGEERVSRTIRFYMAAAGGPGLGRNDILHICSGIKRMGLFKKISMGGKLVLHYHGTDARGTPPRVPQGCGRARGPHTGQHPGPAGLRVQQGADVGSQPR